MSHSIGEKAGIIPNITTGIQKGIKVWGVVPGAEGCQGYIHFDKSQLGLPPMSVSTARTSAVSSTGSMSASGTLLGVDESDKSSRAIAPDGGIACEFF